MIREKDERSCHPMLARDAPYQNESQPRPGPMQTASHPATNVASSHGDHATEGQGCTKINSTAGHDKTVVPHRSNRPKPKPCLSSPQYRRQDPTTACHSDSSYIGQANK